MSVEAETKGVLFQEWKLFATIVSVMTSVRLAVFIRSLFVLAAGSLALPGQARSDFELARQLASRELRSEVLRTLERGDLETERALLRILEGPPAYIDAHEMKVGLADAFGVLRTRAAVPFLIQNISMERWRDMNTTLKSPAVLLERWPAARALIGIGPPALEQLFRAYSASMSSQDRLALIFVVARIPDPRARAFLTEIQTEVRVMDRWIQDGLAEFDRRR